MIETDEVHNAPLLITIRLSSPLCASSGRSSPFLLSPALPPSTPLSPPSLSFSTFVGVFGQETGRFQFSLLRRELIIYTTLHYSNNVVVFVWRRQISKKPLIALMPRQALRCQGDKCSHISLQPRYATLCLPAVYPPNGNR